MAGSSTASSDESNKMPDVQDKVWAPSQLWCNKPSLHCYTGTVCYLSQAQLPAPAPTTGQPARHLGRSHTRTLGPPPVTAQIRS